MNRYRRKSKPVSHDFVICFDHREEGRGKRPLRFDGFDMVRTTLRTGDYSVLGYEDRIALEHKSGIVELYKDLVASYRPTFKRFLQRMGDMQHKVIVVEEPLTLDRVKRVVTKLEYASNGRSRLTVDTMWHWTAAIAVEYGVPIVFADRMAVRQVAAEWLVQAYAQVRSRL